MLVLSRKASERIVVPQCELIVTVLEIAGNRARIGISAPPGIAVHREEVWQRKCAFDAEIVRQQASTREPREVEARV